MDLLYSRYASPMELMNIYINQGRFGEFVTSILESEYQRRKAEAEKEDDNKLWTAYLMSGSDKKFGEWKAEILEKKEPVSYAMTDEQVEAQKQQAKEILSRISPV